MGDQLKELAGLGQSIWLDNIRRSMFASGELQRLIDLGLRGMTSNPTIFEKAIGSGSDYDEQLRTLVDETDMTTAFEQLAIRDIRSACDLFYPVWEATKGLDGYVSLEVSPTLARDTQGTIQAARRLWGEVNRPNLMIKIPGTAEGMPAIKATIAAGINVNVTLLFSVDRYESAATAYLEGLEERAAKGEPIDRIASVASFFVSRIDTSVVKQLQARIDKGERLESLLGKAAIANTKLAYQRFSKLFGGDRFAALKAKGAHVQRPLWASTSTKNPAYPDLMYVDNLIGRDTVNTVPPNTLEAVLDHGNVRPDTVLEDLDGARAVIEALGKAQISLYDVTEELVADGVRSFADSFNAMLSAIGGKLEKLRQGTPPKVAVAAPEGLANEADAALDKLAQSGFLRKLWAHDTSPWSTDPAHAEIIKHALGWVEIAQQTHAQSGELRDFAHACAKRFEHVVVLGMGGSSLAPDVLRATFGKAPDYPALHVLDSTDPQQIKALDDSLDIGRSLFIVASKSGTTTEPDAFFRYFFQRVQQTVSAANASEHFVAITDPGTKLEQEAKEYKFLRTFVNDPNIGGRYSALSYFGMVPAALAGYDVTAILDRAINAMHANAATTAAYDAPGVRFGAALGAFAKGGRDKLTIVTPPSVAAAGAVLGIDAFDQPNVQESKDNTKRLLAEFTAEGKFSEPEPRVRTGDALVFPLSGSRSAALGEDLQSAVAAVAEQIGAGDYVAFNAYVPMNDDDEAALLRIRTTVRDALHVATTVGFGPRFLHSTGQLHKGGSNEGVFFQITYDAPFDLPIPGMAGFRTLQRSQALGDFESLDKRDRRGIRIHFPGDPKAGLAALASALEAAVSAKI